MKKYYYIKNIYTGKKTRVWFERDTYANNNALYIGMMCKDGPYSDVTVNLPNYRIGKNDAFVDTNNNPGIDKWLYKRGIAKPSLVLGISGWCAYPMMRFNMDKI